ncbi:DUF1653 domain-containing protein [Massilia sp. DJPM01]|uniref:DUF1653 domain-containing protein n=1 Tax=Massilia sp. DJPM01 TaxID=3024404 RepID=UPI00259DE2CA|nr:DUF1653 domain-containing protein [Massilia sp. DJPM01]MDM5179452.1 DUF1653 domain-containing protein [Massilia sp. DJPM01]
MQFRHYKGGLYDLVCVATLESDLSEMIVYRAADGSIWTRPKQVFFQLVDVDGILVPRFAPVSQSCPTPRQLPPQHPPPGIKLCE